MNFSSGLGGIWSWLSNSVRPTGSKDSSGSMESVGSPQCEIIKEHIEITAFDDCDSPLVGSNKFSDILHKTSDYLWKNQKNNDGGYLLITSLSKVAKEKINLVIKLSSYRCTHMI